MAESVININFPSQVVSDLEKMSYDYGLKVAKAIQHEWFGGTNGRYQGNIAKDIYNLITDSRFNPKKISQFTLQDVEQLMKNDRIVRNKMKIMSAINNSCRFLEVSAEFGSFDKYVWGFVDNEVILNNYHTWEDVPATSPESEKMSRDMKKRGFTFVGPTICYAFMQAVGMVDDHTVNCFKFSK